MKLFKPTEWIATRTSIRTSRLYVLTCLLTVCVLFFSLQQTATAQAVNIPDSKLRAAIETALGKAAGTPITRAEMANLTSLQSRYNDIRQLTGLESAINLETLDLYGNAVSDISALAALTQLTTLNLGYNRQISDVSALAALTQLTTLDLSSNAVSDISALAALTQLTTLNLGYNRQISDISALAALTRLTRLYLSSNAVSDISALAALTRLTDLYLSSNAVSDISALAALTQLTRLDLSNNVVSDISALAALTRLTDLYLSSNAVSDISALAALTQLTTLNVSNNVVSDISALAALTQLTTLNVSNNAISDVSALAALTQLTTLDLNYNAVSDVSPLTALTAQTSLYFACNLAFGAPGPKIVGPWLWVIAPAPNHHEAFSGSGKDFLAEASGGTVTEQQVALDGATAGDVVGDSVWTQGRISPATYNNIDTLVKAIGLGSGDIRQHVAYGLIAVDSPRVQNTRMYVGYAENLKVWLNGELVHADPQYRYATNYETAFPITLKRGENILLVAVYKRWNNWRGFFGFEAGTDYTVRAQPTGRILAADVNQDGQVTVVDVSMVTASLGQTNPVNPRLDVNGDGIVDGKDIAFVAEFLGQSTDPAAPVSVARPVGLTPETVQHWINLLRIENDGSLTFQHALANLERLLASMVPEKTGLLANYPNPFNPETWIPYQLAERAAVTVSIYSADGKLVRMLELGHQPAGVYQTRSRAAYWNGRNAFGEQVASGVYFYTLTAGEFTATRKMLIRK